MTYRKESVNSKLVSRREITHLFWGIYPYKVETIYPGKGFAPVYTNTGSIYYYSHQNLEHYNKIVADFRRRCVKATPKDKTVWKLYETQTSMHFYFLHKDDMERFIAGNKTRIRAIYQPFDVAVIPVLADGKNVFLRHTLYYDQYRYCMSFRGMTTVQRQELDAWVVDFFGDDRERYKYNPFGKRRLYLNVEDDILFLQLAFKSLILRVDKIILKTEISVDKHESGETPCGEGCDP